MSRRSRFTAAILWCPREMVDPVDNPGTNLSRDRLASLDLEDVYFHIRIAPCLGHSLRVASDGTACQYSVLPFWP